MVADVYGNIAALVGTPVWHGQVEYFEANASKEEIAAKAGFNWTIKQAPTMWIDISTDESGNEIKTPCRETSRLVNYRSDTRKFLSPVTDQFRNHQPGEILDGFSKVCHESNLQLETVGVLQGGKRFWCMASSGLKTTVKEHTHKHRALIATSCDGTLSTFFKNVATCVVCSNTLACAQGENGDTAKQRHRREFDINNLIKQIAATDFGEMFAEYTETMQILSESPVGLATAEEFFKDLLNPHWKEQAIAANEEGKEARKVVNLEKVMDIYQTAPGSSPGNAYGLVQAATFFKDNVAGRTQDTRIDSALFGPGSVFKQKAFNQARELVAA